jgi:hypothetical protein
MSEEKKDIIKEVVARTTARCTKEMDVAASTLIYEEIRGILFSVVAHVLTLYSSGAKDLMWRVGCFCNEQKSFIEKKLQEKDWEL